MTDSIETCEGDAIDPSPPPRGQVIYPAAWPSSRPEPMVTTLVLTVKTTKVIPALAALIESRVSTMDGVVDVESRPHTAKAVPILDMSDPQLGAALADITAYYQGKDSGV